jgi:hypothetical protein
MFSMEWSSPRVIGPGRSEDEGIAAEGAKKAAAGVTI